MLRILQPILQLLRGGQYLPDCHTKYCMQTRKNKSINSRQGGQLAPDYPHGVPKLSGGNLIFKSVSFKTPHPKGFIIAISTKRVLIAIGA